jgi:hypothetical protein
VKRVVDKLRNLGAERVEELQGISERVVFPLPRSLAAEI